MTQYTNSSGGKSINKMYDTYIDKQIYYIDRVLEVLRLNSRITMFTNITQIGIEYNKESYYNIAENLPPNSILVYNKWGDQTDFYPEGQRAGLLTVKKAEDMSRVEFTYTNYNGMWIAFYDELRTNNASENWSGWTKVGGGGSGGTGTTTFERINIKGLGHPENGSILLHAPIDGNNKNLGWSGSRFEQVVAKNGYFDKIEVTKPVIVTGTRGNSEQKGAYIFDETLGKPIWYNGTHWVDAMGNKVN